ncbi:SAM-dependent DNA methyltransferase [Vibrio parahaemolyticus]|nr:SAM-dependent DNA methyltransferase [Vibrio parahaemolyticus]
MAIMHPRVAHNYLKDGYYPTDEATLHQIALRLSLKAGTQRLLDPCCGEGLALAQLVRDLPRHKASELHTYGVELDAGRANAAASRLDSVLRSNAFDTVIGAGSQSVLFLNPPYGDTVTDQMEKQARDMARLEVQFTQRQLPTLKRDGVFVLVVPLPSLTPAFCRYLAMRLREVQVFHASTDRFKQVVLLGRKADMRDRVHQAERTLTAEALMQVGQGEGIPESLRHSTVFEVAAVSAAPFRFEMVRPDINQLEQAFDAHQGLWSSFEVQFANARQRDIPRPLRRLSPWHLSLSLAAGQIAGKVVSSDGQRTLLVKGGTQKVQRTVTHVDEHQTVTTTVDQFKPLIRGIELTQGESFGRIVVIE